MAVAGGERAHTRSMYQDMDSTRGVENLKTEGPHAAWPVRDGISGERTWKGRSGLDSGGGHQPFLRTNSGVVRGG